MEFEILPLSKGQKISKVCSHFFQKYKQKFYPKYLLGQKFKFKKNAIYFWYFLTFRYETCLKCSFKFVFVNLFFSISDIYSFLWTFLSLFPSSQTSFVIAFLSSWQKSLSTCNSLLLFYLTPMCWWHTACLGILMAKN